MRLQTKRCGCGNILPKFKSFCQDCARRRQAKSLALRVMRGGGCIDATHMSRYYRNPYMGKDGYEAMVRTYNR